jgi:hypothetical protein
MLNERAGRGPVYGSDRVHNRDFRELGHCIMSGEKSRFFQFFNAPTPADRFSSYMKRNFQRV